MQRVKGCIYLCVFFFEVGFRIRHVGLRFCVRLKVAHAGDPPASSAQITWVLHNSCLITKLNGQPCCDAHDMLGVSLYY